jgi:hypothetical protein
MIDKIFEIEQVLERQEGDVRITLDNAKCYVTLGRTDKGVFISLDDGYGNEVFYDPEEALAIMTYALYLLLNEARK